MVFQFKIQIANISKPPVWRRILVPDTFTFHDFHNVIQIVFGWEDCHLYMFNPSGYGSTPCIALPSEDDWEKPDLNASKTTLKKVFNAKTQTYNYIYDFGDDWIHKITLEEILPQMIKLPICLGGKGTCPPEDCGGPWGYENLKAIMGDHSNAEYKEMKEWLGMEDGDEWEADQFDLGETNLVLKNIFS